MNNNTYIARVVKYMRKTYRNKLVAMGLLIPGVLAEMITNDGTALIFLMVFAIPMFFTNKNCIQ